MSLAFLKKIRTDLERQPRGQVSGIFAGAPYTARIAIPDYADHLTRHFNEDLATCKRALDHAHFGVIVDFENPVEVEVHNTDQRLNEDLRALVARFGPTLLRNVQLPPGESATAQRNIFPSLKFHIDRGRTQVEQYSLFWRDPLDPEQQAPRTSSTLIMPTHAALLQARSEGRSIEKFDQSYNLFKDGYTDELTGKVVLELAWNASQGTGEISVLDNRTVVHASYYRHMINKGYPISVRYLA